MTTVLRAVLLSFVDLLACAQPAYSSQWDVEALVATASTSPAIPPPTSSGRPELPRSSPLDRPRHPLP